MFFRLALKSLLNRKASVILTIVAMSVSIFVLLGVEHIRQQSKSSFASTVSGVDLIVGARTGQLNLLLYSVFHTGSPTNNISWKTYQTVANSRHIDWAVPISLGDSHNGYRVMGTTTDYFAHYRYGNKHSLQFSHGQAFDGVFDVVLGFEVAAKLGYQLGDEIVLSHGIAKTSFSKHDDTPFRIVGILGATGTPVDQTLLVSLQAIEAIHMDWQQGVKNPNSSLTPDKLTQMELQPESITAFMLGLKSRMATFKVQRDINNYRREPLTAVLPGVALSELWSMMRIFENTLRLISVLVLVAALLGLSAMLTASIREREQEIHLLRVIGAPSIFLFLLIQLEALLISLVSIISGAALLYISLIASSDLLTQRFSFRLEHNILSEQSMLLLGLVLLATVLAAALPAFNAYRNAVRLK